MSVAAAVFSTPVRAVMRALPPLLDADAGIAAAAAALESRATVAFIVGPTGALVGCVTAGDLVRVLARRAALDDPLDRIAAAPAQVARQDELLYVAIGRMRRHQVLRLPVIDDAGRPVGLLELADALAATAAPPLEQIDRLAHEGSLDGLQQVKAAQVELAAELLAGAMPATRILGILSDINRDLHRRVVERGLRGLADQGWGPPPVPFCLIVMGSGGRGESFIFPDQDNGLILDDYPAAQRVQVDAFFLALAQRLTTELDAVGFPLCRGGVMATSPLWRRTRSEWRAQLARWGRDKDPEGLLQADIVLDFRAAFGRAAFAEELRDVVAQELGARPRFLRELVVVNLERWPIHGLFGRFVRDAADARRRVDLKRCGLLPLVASARVVALKLGIDALGTPERLAAIERAGFLGADERHELAGAFAHIAELLLRQQVVDFVAGRPVGMHVEPSRLPRRDRRMLRDGLRAIGRFRDRVRLDIAGGA